jgi:hypothetical protein
LISIPWNFSSRTLGRKKLDSERQSGPKAGGFACSRCRGELPAA